MTAERMVLAELALIGRPATVGTVTRRLGPDARDVRAHLDALVRHGAAVYLGGQGNNRRYELAQKATPGGGV